MENNLIQYREIKEEDRPRLFAFMQEFWHSTRMVTRGRLFEPYRHEGFIANIGTELAGVVTYEIIRPEMEITLLHALMPRQGIGRQLLNLCRKKAMEGGLKRIWLVTTNDNSVALNFYQSLGFVLTGIYENVMEEYRKIKPEIPLTGYQGTPILHEFEWEWLLGT